MSQAPLIFMVDDQAGVLKALGRLLNAAGFSSQAYTSAQTFLDSGNAAAPGCLILDLAMPEMDGFALQKALVARSSDLPIIFLSGHAGIRDGVQAMKAGAADFLTKPVDEDALINAVQQALERNQIARNIRLERDNVVARLASLTAREREVMDLIIEGKLNKQIADTLVLAEKTVKIHRARVMNKMQVRSVAVLVSLLNNLKDTPA
ncbi:response regulator [Pseudomonas sp.]|uniref:response regulator transcription factor n=1 Tax=Pseudomonas sp. TaxID=306 RepID=UPI002619E4F2|nr:response regulator [Pseudomonas sp.]